MLTATKLHPDDTQKVVGYLLRGGRRQDGRLRATDYYLRPGGTPETGHATYWGRGAEQLGLGGAVDETTFKRVLEGCKPDGQRVVADGAAGHVAAIDLTFTVPGKRISLLWASAKPEQRADLQHLHDEAVERALSYIEDTAPVLRRRLDRQTVVHEKSQGLVVIRAQHCTARPARATRAALPGRAADHAAALDALEGSSLAHEAGEARHDWSTEVAPHLHEHAVVANLALDRNGKWRALDRLELLRMQAEAGAVYHRTLLEGLVERGFGVSLTGDRRQRYFEIAGVREEVIRSWSQRHAEVERRRAELEVRLGRPLTDAEAGDLGRDSRLHKPHDLESRQLLAAWKTALAVQGVRWDALTAAHEQAPAPEALTPETVVRRAVDELAEKRGAFGHEDLRAAVAKHGVGHLTTGQLLATLESLHRAQEAGETPAPALGVVAYGKHLARRAHAEREQAVLDRIGELAAAEPAVAITPEAVEARERRVLAAKGLPDRARLSDEQRVAVEHLLSNRVAVVTGHAGSGKGMVGAVVTDAWMQAHGPEARVFHLATAGIRAVRWGEEARVSLAESTSVDKRSMARTLASFNAALTGQDGKPPTVRLRDTDLVMVDEAGLVSTDDFAKLTEAIAAQGATPALSLVGDRKQLRAVTAGGLLVGIQERIGPGAVLTEVHRTYDPFEREAQANLRDGAAPGKALLHYAAPKRLGKDGQVERTDSRLHVAPNREAARHEAVRQWAARWNSEKRDAVCLVTDGSNADVAALNALAQRYRLARLTDAEREAIGVAKGAKAQVDRQHWVKVTHGEGAEAREETLFVGDVVTIRETMWLGGKGSQRKILRNGDRGTVVGTDPDAIRVAIWRGEAGRTTVRLEQRRWGAVQLGYVQHVYTAQGRTTDDAVYVPRGRVNRTRAYVACTRARRETRVVADAETLDVRTQDANWKALAFDALGRRMARKPDRTTASDVAEAAAALVAECEVETQRVAQAAARREHTERRVAQHMAERARQVAEQGLGPEAERVEHEGQDADQATPRRDSEVADAEAEPSWKRLEAQADQLDRAAESVQAGEEGVGGPGRWVGLQAGLGGQADELAVGEVLEEEEAGPELPELDRGGLEALLPFLWVR